jgi:hypothetical protein
MADKKISQLSAASTPLAGTEVLPIVQSSATVKVSIDNLTKGKTVLASSFDTDVAAAGVTLSGTTLAADGTDTNIDINITPKGTGEVNLPKVDIDAGAIDGTPIGANSASTGAFTTLSASSTVSGTGFTNLFASPPAIGGTAANTGNFTKLNVSATQRILSKSATVLANSSGTATISASDFGGVEIEGSMLVIAGGYGQAVSGNVLGMWLIGGWLFLNDASTSTVVEIVNSVGNGTLTCARSGSTYVVTLNNTNLDYSKTLRVSAILNG